MNVINYMRHVETIERDIVDNKLDSIVIGLGPTGHLLPWIDRKLLLNLRLWGTHDAFRIFPVDDLLIMDSPNHSPRLKPGTKSIEIICDSRPKRLWLYKANAKTWTPHLHHSMESVTKIQDFFVWQNPKLEKGEKGPDKFELEWTRPHTGLVSPLGATTLAWKEGCRRIGVLGVEMGPDHNTHGYRGQVDAWFTEIANQAHQKGGLIKNLSPITHLKHFKKWTPSESQSEPTSGSKTPEQKPCSSTASASTAPDQSKSPGCDPETKDGKSAQRAKKAHGQPAEQLRADGSKAQE